jgi:uracil-DNA glycosylase
MIAERKSVRELLAFYLEAGVDTSLAETPENRFADEATVPPVTASPPDAPRASPKSTVAAFGDRQQGLQPVRPLPAAPPSPEAAIMEAREAARCASSLDELRAILGRFDGCTLKSTATQLVFADGNPRAPIMFVGEAPGRDEDIEGVPFVGRSGKLLDRMLAAIGLDRSGVYIANIIPWRPPGNRTPIPQESQMCLPFIRRQIELADPNVLVCLGQPSMQALLGIKEGIGRSRGRWFTYDTGTREIRATATLHPAYLLRQPLQKRLAWRDFLAIKKALAGL